MRTIACALIGAAAIVWPAAASAQSARPIRIIVASAPGGPSDVQARLLTPRVMEALGRAIVVDNRASNNGVQGTDIAAKAAPDGYTFAVGNSGTHGVNATLYLKLPYDPVRDFAPVTEFSTTGLVVAANPKLPGTRLEELVAYAKQNPGKVNVAIPGATGQLAGDALWQRLRISLTDVNYKGSAPSEMALLAGECQVSMLTPLAAMNHLQSGRLKAYGITSPQRHPLLPNLPTIAEQGVTGYDFQFWNGLFAPARTPPRIVRAMNQAVVGALHSPEVSERFAQLGLVIVANTPEEFAQVVKGDVEKYRKVILESGIPRL